VRHPIAVLTCTRVRSSQLGEPGERAEQGSLFGGVQLAEQLGLLARLILLQRVSAHACDHQVGAVAGVVTIG